MQNKKSDRTNLQFFSNIATKQLETELNALVHGNQSLNDSINILDHAYADLHLIYWHITHEIGLIKRIIVNNNHNTEVMKSPEVKKYFQPVDDPNDDLAGFRVTLNNISDEMHK